MTAAWPIEPRTGRTFPASIASDDWYLWDNCGYVEAGVTHIYAQAADRRMCATPEDRYWRAYWRHFTSQDDGWTWVDEGPALWPRLEPGAYDGYNIWSGSVLLEPGGRKIAAYTGLESGKLALQSIALAVSDDGHAFQRVSDERPLISATRDYDELTALGYYLGRRSTLGDEAREVDGTFLCLRDPYLFADTDGSLHLFFGAKARVDRDVVRAVGHGVVASGRDGWRVELLPPLHVPDADEFNQLELPNVVRRGDTYYLVISTTNLAYIGQPDAQAEKSVRIYRSERLDGAWHRFGGGGRHVLLTPDSRLYGLSIVCDRAQASGLLTCRAFWVGETSLPPSFRLDVSGSDPLLVFPEQLWALSLDVRRAGAARSA
jgi:hypothetical protein